MNPTSHGDDWIKVDLHIHTLDDPKDHLDYTAHQLLERAHDLGFGALAITLHDKVFDRPEVYADAAAIGILLIPAAEMRLEGADVVVLNVQPNEIANLRTFADLRKLRERLGDRIFIFAPHPFFYLGATLGKRLLQEIDCFDGIEICHFHKGIFDLNRKARQVAAAHGKPLLATSDAHSLDAFGSHFTMLPRPAELTPTSILRGLREGPLRLTSPSSSWRDLWNVFYFVFLKHPMRKRQSQRVSSNPSERGRSCAGGRVMSRAKEATYDDEPKTSPSSALFPGSHLHGLSHDKSEKGCQEVRAHGGN